MINDSSISGQETPSTALLMLRGVLPLALMGVIIGLVSLLLIPWPTVIPEDSPLTTAPHVLRLTQFSPSTLADVSIYVALVFALIFTGMAWRSGRRGALIGLVGVGAFGMLYAAINLIPFLGPLMNLCGFGLILTGGAMSLALSQPGETPAAVQPAFSATLPEADTVAESVSEPITSESLPSEEAV